MAGTTAELRRLNKNRIYRLLYTEKQATKQDIARMLSLSLPTVNLNLKELIAEELVCDGDILDSTGGRKPKAFSAVEDARIGIGIEISANHIRLIAIDIAVNELAYHKISHPFSMDETYSNYLSTALEEFITENSLMRDKLLGVGIAIPGIVDNEQGIIQVAPTLHLRNANLEILTKDIPFPCMADNDANAGGFAELWSRNKLDNNIAFLSVGKGVGGAILVDGNSYIGMHKRSGEFGHMCVERDGRVCNCGKMGCLEAYCSTDRISYDLGITIEVFFFELENGNSDYKKIWDDYISHLAVGINNARMILDCDIVLGGTICPYIGKYLGNLQSLLAKLNTFEDDGSYLSLCRYRSKSNCIGMALRYISQFLQEI